MDFDSLKNQVAGLTLYDLKAGFRKAQNAVMNYTEMEAKVREATNNEPWGASTTMMQEIANATFNYATLNEIMPMIYKRFTEKSAEEWRQIYKALQLLEFLIKNGSERVIDDARTHLSLLKMLRQFHYIDLNGKDQGLNVRNRAKELAELLSDVERIRTERKKARVNRNKYGGVEGGAGADTFSSSSRYGGFGSESAVGSTTFGGYSGGVYGDGGGFGGNAADDYEGTQAHREKFQAYDEYDEGAITSPTSATSSRAAAKATRTTAPKPEPKAVPKPKEPEVDLFDFNDEPITSPATSNGKQPAGPVRSSTNDFGGFVQSTPADDDEFDDFQSASPTVTTSAAPTRTSNVSSATQFASPVPLAAPQSSFANNLYSTISPPSGNIAAPNYSSFTSPPPASINTFQQPAAAIPLFQPAQPSRPYQSNQPNYFGSIQATAANTQPTSPTQANRSNYTSPLGGSRPAPKNASGGDPFAVLAGSLGGKKGAGAQNKGPTMADLNKERTTAGIWGASAGSVGMGGAQRPAQNGQGQAQGSAGDLLGL